MTQHKSKLPDLSRSEWEKLIDEWIFSERDRAIFLRWLFDDIGYDSLSLEFGLTSRQVKNIVYRTEERLVGKMA